MPFKILRDPGSFGRQLDTLDAFGSGDCLRSASWWLCLRPGAIIELHIAVFGDWGVWGLGRLRFRFGRLEGGRTSRIKDYAEPRRWARHARQKTRHPRSTTDSGSTCIHQCNILSLYKCLSSRTLSSPKLFDAPEV